MHFKKDFSDKQKPIPTLSLQETQIEFDDTQK